MSITIPASGLPARGPNGGRLAYVAIGPLSPHFEDYSLGVAEENQSGYWAIADISHYGTYAEASAAASLRNVEELGLTVKEALSIALSSMGRKGVA